MARTSKLTDRQIVDIRRRYTAGEDIWLIAARHGISTHYVHGIGTGWKHPRVAPDEPPRKRGNSAELAPAYERQATRQLARRLEPPHADEPPPRTNADLAARRKAANARLAELRAKQGERLAMFGDKPKER